MSQSPVKGPSDEQKICLTCGFCCDGTLFLHATLYPGESGHLPEKIEQSRFTQDDKEFFRLPCLYFSEKCIIYDSKRADICSSYRCQLLKDYAGGKITMDEALEIVKGAMSMRTSILDQYRKISGESNSLNFRQLLVDIGKIRNSSSEEAQLCHDYDMLQIRCNIFEALLIKHIRSASDFDNIMVAPSSEKPQEV
jgi:hypothetical protein